MPKRKVADVIDKALINESASYIMAHRYLELQKLVKDTTAISDEIKTELKELVTKEGVVIPASGSYHLELGTDKVKKIILTNICRTTIKPKATAVEIVKSKFPEFADQLIETAEYFREDRIEGLLESGKLTKEQAEQLLSITTNYAFTCKADK